MMEYGAVGAAQLNQIKAVPELGRLKAAAERVSKAAWTVDNFLDRFHGPRPQSASDTPETTADNYRNDLDSLFKAIDRLENAISALDHIG